MTLYVPTQTEQFSAQLSERCRVAAANILARLNGSIVGLEQGVPEPLEFEDFDRYTVHFFNWRANLEEVTRFVDEWKASALGSQQAVAALKAKLAAAPRGSLEDDRQRERLEGEIAAEREKPSVYMAASTALRADMESIAARFRGKATRQLIGHCEAQLLSFGQHAARGLQEKAEGVVTALAAFHRLKAEVEGAHLTMREQYSVEVPALAVTVTPEIRPLSAVEVTVGKKR